MISEKQFISWLSLVLFLLLPRQAVADVRPLVEFDQILCLRAGAEYCPEYALGIKCGAGTSVFSINTVSLNLMAVYRLHPNAGNWIFDLETGIPLAYFDALEGTCVDWDPMIEGPYAGFVAGFSCSSVYAPWGLGLRLGGGLWWEWQRSSGMKGPRAMPVVSLSYRNRFTRRENLRK